MEQQLHEQHVKRVALCIDMFGMEERSKAHVSEKLEQQQRAEKRLRCVEATIARLEKEQADILLRSLWSSWIEFAEKGRQEKALQEASLEHASQNRQRASVRGAKKTTHRLLHEIGICKATRE